MTFTDFMWRERSQERFRTHLHVEGADPRSSAERNFMWRERNRSGSYQASAASKALMSSSGVPHEVQKRAKRRPSGSVSQMPYCTLRESRSCPA